MPSEAILPAKPAAGEHTARAEVKISQGDELLAIVALTDIERRILRRFLESPDALLGVEELVAAVWGQPPDPESERKTAPPSSLR